MQNVAKSDKLWQNYHQKATTTFDRTQQVTRCPGTGKTDPELKYNPTSLILRK